MSFEDMDDMCPNCQTPWKCNGPHLVGQTRRDRRAADADLPSNRERGLRAVLRDMAVHVDRFSMPIDGDKDQAAWLDDWGKRVLRATGYHQLQADAAAAHARGVAEERARMTDAIAETDPVPPPFSGTDGLVDAWHARGKAIRALQHPPSGVQDGPGAPEVV